MRTIYSALSLIFILHTAVSYSKFGRKCEDIGCASNEECVMATKTCSYFDRQDECGEYPTCKKLNSGPRTCTGYVCPPSKVCKMDGGIPKCFDDSSKVGSVPLYDTSNINSRNGDPNNYQPSAPSSGGDGNRNPSYPSAPNAPSSQGGSSLYPNLGGNNGYQPQGGGYSNPNYNNGYQQPGNGYQQPKYGPGYQQPGGNYNYNNNNQRPGYGQQGGYRNPGGYNQGGYNQGGYNPGGYNQGGYNQGGYNQGVPGGYQVAGAGYQQPGNGYRNQGYGGYKAQNNSAGGSITDSIKDALKKIGSDFISKTISDALKKNTKN